MELLRKTAAAKLKAEQLQWWWCKHYNRPLLDPLLQQYTIEELQVEHLMFMIEENPQHAYPRGDMGKVQFRTGDPIVDEWEQKIADGVPVEKINFDTGVDPTFLARFKDYSKRLAERMSPALQEARLRAEATTELPPEDQAAFLADLAGSMGFTDDYT